MSGLHEDPAVEGPARRLHWPDWAEAEPEERVELHCPSCSVEWWIHVDLAGYRLRCECGAWIAVPPDERRPASLSVGSSLRLGAGPAPHADEDDADSKVALRRGARGEPLMPVGFQSRTIPTNAPVAAGTLRHADLQSRRRWIDRSILELGAMMSAFWIPAATVWTLTDGRDQALFMPLADLAAGVLVLLIGLTASGFTFAGLKSSRARYWVEAVFVALCAAALALGWSHLLSRFEGIEENWLFVVRDELGLVWTLFAIGVCPAIFEELAFRGLLQARLTALFGRWPGILVTGTAFAVAHGITLGFPFHAFLGIYLCLLRERSGSLYPCMLLHFVYNSAIVLLL